MIVYKSLKRHLKNYQDSINEIVKFENMDYAFMQGFQNFLINHKIVHRTTGTVSTLNNITIAKQLSTLKTFLGYAKRKGFKIADGYRDFTIKKEKLEVIALNKKEFDCLYALDLTSNSRLDQVRDVFLFSCVTGCIRVPALIEWPGKIEAGQKTNLPISTSDIFPTILGILGFENKNRCIPWMASIYSS